MRAWLALWCACASVMARYVVTREPITHLPASPRSASCVTGQSRSPAARSARWSPTEPTRPDLEPGRSDRRWKGRFSSSSPRKIKRGHHRRHPHRSETDNRRRTLGGLRRRRDPHLRIGWAAVSRRGRRRASSLTPSRTASSSATGTAARLLDAGGVQPGVDDGTMLLDGPEQSAQSFVNRCRGLRFWDREPLVNRT